MIQFDSVWENIIESGISKIPLICMLIPWRFKCSLGMRTSRILVIILQFQCKYHCFMHTIHSFTWYLPKLWGGFHTCNYYKYVKPGLHQMWTIYEWSISVDYDGELQTVVIWITRHYGRTPKTKKANHACVILPKAFLMSRSVMCDLLDRDPLGSTWNLQTKMRRHQTHIYVFF